MYSVLTGDIVASSKLGAQALDQTLAAIADAADAIGTWPGVTVVGFARRGGDAWQIAFDAPRFGLRAALFITACIRRLEKKRASRIAIAAGAGEMPDLDPNAAHGPAFTQSGRLLGRLPSAIYLGDASGGARAAAAILADQITRGWTQAQARALAEQLPPGAGPRTDAAAKLQVKRQAIDQALRSAGFKSIQAALKELEAE